MSQHPGSEANFIRVFKKEAFLESMLTYLHCLREEIHERLRGTATRMLR